MVKSVRKTKKLILRGAGNTCGRKLCSKSKTKRATVVPIVFDEGSDLDFEEAARENPTTHERDFAKSFVRQLLHKNNHITPLERITNYDDVPTHMYSSPQNSVHSIKSSSKSSRKSSSKSSRKSSRKSFIKSRESTPSPTLHVSEPPRPKPPTEPYPYRVIYEDPEDANIKTYN